jgi:hypothetical protein
MPCPSGSLRRKDESRQDETHFVQTNVLLIDFNPFAFGYDKWVSIPQKQHSEGT